MDRPVDPDTCEVTARISRADLARLDRMAARRGVERSDLLRDAVDALLAREAWSGGFIPPPPALEIPPPFRAPRRRDRRSRER